MTIVASIEDQAGNHLSSRTYAVTQSDGSRERVYELSVEDGERGVTIYIEPESLVQFLMDGGLAECMTDVLEKGGWATANPDMQKSDQ